MTDLRLSQLPDGDLEDTIRGLAGIIDWPVAAPGPDRPDVAALVRARLESGPQQASRWTWRPARRALVFALIALLALAAIAGAVGFGLPGLRLIFGGAPVSPPPSLEPSRSPAAGPPGATMGLGERVELADVDARAGFDVRWPNDPAIGPPDAAYIDVTKGGQVSLVWATRPDLPATLEPGVGLLLSQFRGEVDAGVFSKLVNGGTTVERLQVGDGPGYWLSGDSHILFWKAADGFVDDGRRWVSDVLLWSVGEVTYRLETALGRDEAIRLATSLD